MQRGLIAAGKSKSRSKSKIKIRSSKHSLLNGQSRVDNPSQDLLVNGGFNILLAEDNADDAFLLKEAFKKANVTNPLTVVPDGVEVLAYLKGEGAYSDRGAHPFPDVLLLDLNMPRMNGFEVLEWVRQDARCSRLMVHILTASPREADVQQAYDLHANSYVIKPSRMDELVAFAAALHEWHRFTPWPRRAETAAL